MGRSEIRHDSNGQPDLLTVYYNSNRWDEAITEARRRHGLEDARLTVMAFPEGED